MERNIRILKWIHGLLGFLPATAIWILFFSDVSGSVATGALVFTCGMFVAALLDLPTGVFSDRVGRKPAAILAAMSLLICVVLYASAHSLWQLLLGAVFDGVGMGFLSGNNVALLRESLAALGRGDEFAVQYGRLQGWYHWTALVATIVGAAVATVSIRATVVVGIPFYLAASVLAFWLKEPEQHVERIEGIAGHIRTAVGSIVRSRRLILLAIASMLSGGIGMVCFHMRPSWTQGLWPIWAVSLARAGSALFAALGSWWGGAAVARFGALRALVTTQLLSSVIDIVVLAFASVISPAVLTSSSLAYGVGMTADGVLLQEEFSDGQRATLGSIVGVGTKLVYGLGALGFGVMAGQAALALVVGEVLLVGSVGMYIAAFRPHPALRREAACIPSY